MKFDNMVKAIDLHVAGEPIRLIVDGFPYLRGETMREKMKYLQKNYDWLRAAVIREPRGFRDLFAGIITEPVSKGAACGVIYADCNTYYPMCGTGTIALASMLVETGRIEVEEPQTEVYIDTPGGQVRCMVEVKGGKAVAGEYTNIPSFLYRRAVIIDSSYFGPLSVDIGYGGNFVVFVDSEQTGRRITKENYKTFIDPALEIIELIRERIDIKHPERDITTIDSCMFCDERPGNLLVIGRGQVARSASGTGTPARMAREYARGKLKLHEQYIHHSLLGTKLKGKLIAEARVGNYPAVIAKVKSRAFIIGISQLIIDSEDPLREGIFI